MSELVYLDSDLHLKKHGIHKLIVIGLIGALKQSEGGTCLRNPNTIAAISSAMRP